MKKKKGEGETENRSEKYGQHENALHGKGLRSRLPGFDARVGEHMLNGTTGVRMRVIVDLSRHVKNTHCSTARASPMLRNSKEDYLRLQLPEEPAQQATSKVVHNSTT
jgi:hypothetical protein